MTDENDTVGTYLSACLYCGALLVGMNKSEFIAHLRDNGETLAADMHELAGALSAYEGNR
ncbi:MAG TPA: hypothetical protein VFJ06_02200 [Halococcus sp.]|nr:hypothetical protein [Halococcus sp.]